MEGFAQEIAAAGIQHPGFGADGGADAIQHADGAGAAAGFGIIAEHGLRRAGAQHRNAADGG